MKLFNGQTIVAIAGILGTSFWVFVLSNLFDASLRPEVQQELEWHLPATAYDDNGFLILLGMNEPEGTDAMRAGKRILEDEVLKYEIYQQTHPKPPAKDAPANQTIFKLQESLCDTRQQKNCVEYYLAQGIAKRQQLIEENQLILDRYREIRDSKHYVESIPPYVQALLPSYSTVMYAAKLEHVMAVSEIAMHREEIAAKRLLETARFSRKLLREGGTLIAHMVALSMIRNDIRIASELLYKYPKLVKYAEPFSEILAPITTSEYSIAKALSHERKYSLKVMEHLEAEYLQAMEKEGREYLYYLLSIFLHKNATMNLTYDLHELRIGIATIETHQLDATVAKAKVSSDKLFGSSIAELVYFNNPLGKILLKIGEPEYMKYIERQHDMEGYIRLVALQHKLIVEKIDAEVIPEILKKSAQQYVNPYTLAPMLWDAEKSELIFEGRQIDKSDSGKRVLYSAKLPKVLIKGL